MRIDDIFAVEEVIRFANHFETAKKKLNKELTSNDLMVNTIIFQQHKKKVKGISLILRLFFFVY